MPTGFVESRHSEGQSVGGGGGVRGAEQHKVNVNAMLGVRKNPINRNTEVVDVQPFRLAATSTAAWPRKSR